MTRNNNYYGCYANLHDISSDPQFIGNGNYRLASISLCIDAGSNTVPGIPLTDKDGNLRIINGTVDIGAYEYQNIPSFTGSISGTVTDTLGNPISGALVKVTSGNLTKALSTRGEVITGTDGTFTITNLPFGTYTLRASFSGYHHSYRKVVVFSSISGVVITMLSTSTTLLYVAATNTSGIENGSSDTPYSVIQMGVDTAINGNTIKVGSGLYRGGIFINRQIRVIGAGEDITIIDGGVGFSGNFDSNYSIEGFKITGGNKGIYCNNANPTITNNTISGNSWGIYCKDSAFPNITNNIILGNSLYGIFCIFSSVTITNNIISRSRWDGISCYSSSGTIYNNIITENGTTSNYYYYGIYQSNSNLTIDYNCVWGNGLNGNRNYFGCNPGFNDICLDPQFTSDFYLKQTSPCIDAGDNSAPGLPLTDKDGNPRIINDIVDMGAYEYQGRTMRTGITSNLIEEFSRSSTFTDTIISQESSLFANVGGDLKGNLTGNLEIVTVKTGVFSNKGFLKGTFTTILDNILYSGNLKGIIYPEGTKTILTGVIKGNIEGTFEGYLIDSSYIAIWTLHKVRNRWVSCKISLSGNLTSQETQEYPTNLSFSQSSLNGTASGQYNESLNLILNYIRINDTNNPYNNHGFSFISYNSSQGSGKGWLYGEKKENITEMEGLFSQPLLGYAYAELNEETKEFSLSITNREDLNKIEPELNITILGPNEVSPGQTISYVVELRNYGIKQAENITVIAAPGTFTNFISASENYEYFTIAHWEDIENWQTSKVYQVPRIRWDFSEIPVKSVITLNFQVKVKWGLSEGFYENAEVWIMDKKEADGFYFKYNPEGDHCLDGGEE